MYKPIILQDNGKVIFYKNLCHTDEESIKISAYLKTISIQTKIDNLYEFYELDDYALINLVLNGSDYKDIFIKFINDNSDYPFPKELLDKLINIEQNIKEVILELGDGEVLLKVLRGDISFIESLNKKNKIIDKSSKDIYKFKINNLHDVCKNLNKNKVIIKLPITDVTSVIDINKNTINMRYYQRQAFNLLKDRSYGILIMPVFSGKNYVALNIINYVKKKTLIFCHGKEQLERWKEQLINLLGVGEERISLCDSENFTVKDFVLCNYEYIRTNRKIIENLLKSEWGIVIYDDAHKAVTDKVIDILMIKSERKLALASSLDRSDGKEIEIFSVFGTSVYYISNKELIDRLYQKELVVEIIKTKGSNKTKEDIIRQKLLDFENESVIIASHKIENVEAIASYLNIDFLNQNTIESDREELVNKFNNKKINTFSCSNLLEKYRFTNVDIMIAAGYRGGTEIEENFRVGTLISTTDKLDKMKKAILIYLINNADEEKMVSKKIEYIKGWGLM